MWLGCWDCRVFSSSDCPSHSHAFVLYFIFHPFMKSKLLVYNRRRRAQFGCSTRQPGTSHNNFSVLSRLQTIETSLRNNAFLSAREFSTSSLWTRVSNFGVQNQSIKLQHPLHKPRCHFSSAPATEESWWNQSTTKLLDRELTPVATFDEITWHKAECMIIYWADRRKEGLDICLSLLERMADEASANPDSNFTMNIYLIHGILSNWKGLLREGQVEILPSQILSILDACLEKAPSCFEPNIATYTMILDGAASCPNPKERIVFTQDLLDRLVDESQDKKDLRPTAITFGTIIKAWAKSGSVKLAEESEELLRRVLTLRDEHGWDHLEVNTILYTSVLGAYSRAGEPESAERLLREMFQEFVGGNKDVQPNIVTINTVLLGWSKSSSPKAFESAEILFKGIENLQASGALAEGPDAISYNNLLNTLAKSRQVPNAVEKAESLVSGMLDNSLRPTIHTFTVLLRILARSRHPEKDKKIDYWLSEAKRLKVRDLPKLMERHSPTREKRRPRAALPPR